MLETHDQASSMLVLPPGTAPVVVREERTVRRRRRAPWTRPAAEWAALEPRGVYAKVLRTPFLYALALALVPVAVLAAVPVFLVNAALHRGPRRAFFLQRRVGRRGELFTLFKFRTMRDPVSGEPSCDGARVTSFGRFLRNTHLDEVPQLLNVLRGEMALIGPRPEMVSVERWACERWDDFSLRLVLRPGLTGLAQITQGYAAEGDARAYRRKFELNMRYACEVGPLLDLSILARTAVWMMRRRGWRSAPALPAQDARARA